MSAVSSMPHPDASATQGEKTYARLRSDIVFARLPPGRRLTLDRLRKQYATSVGTLREVLNRLTSEGLVVAEGARGFEVAPVSAGNLEQLASMRVLLECHAMQASFAAGDVDWEGRVVAAHHKLAAMERRMASGDHSAAETWKRYDFEFHHSLVSACGSDVLLETHRAVYDRYLRYQMVAGLYRGDVASAEHASLLAHALARDAVAAQATLCKHVHDCVAHIVDAGLLDRREATPVNQD